MYCDNYGDVGVAVVSDQDISDIYCSWVILSGGTEAVVRTNVACPSEGIIDYRLVG